MKCTSHMLTALAGLAFVALGPMPAFAQAVSAAGSAADRSSIVVPKMHSGAIMSASFSPDGKWIVTGGTDKFVKIWDVNTGRLLRTLEGHSGVVYSVAISPDGRRIASRGDSGLVLIVDPETGKHVSYLQAGRHTRIQFTRDGRFLFGADDGKVHLWAVASGQSTRTYGGLRDSEFLSSVAISPDEQLIAGGDSGDASMIHVWSAGSGSVSRKWRAHTGSIHTLEFAPNGRWIASAAYEGFAKSRPVKLWDASTGKLVRQFQGHTDDVNAISFSADSSVMYSTSNDETIRAWSTATGRPIWSVKLDSANHLAVLSPDRQSLLAGGGNISLLEPSSGRVVRKLGSSSIDRDASIVSVAGDDFLVSGSGGLGRWSAETGELLPVSKAKLGRLSSTAVMANGRKIALSQFKNSVMIVDAANGQIFTTINVPQSPGGSLSHAAISADGRLIATTSYKDQMVRLWDAASGRQLRAIKAYDGYGSGVAISPDGRFLLTSGWGDGPSQTKLWNLETGALVRSYAKTDKDPGSALLFLPDGRSFLSVGQNGLALRSVVDGNEMSGPSERGFFLGGAVLNPDSSKLAFSETTTPNIRLLNVADGSSLYRLRGLGEGGAIAFSARSDRLVAARSNGTIETWNTLTGDLLTTAIQADSGEWVTITPEGFFSASAKGAELLYSVRGFAMTGIDQFYQSLYRPDLVQEKLAGDPKGLVKTAAAKLDLDKVLASGDAPAVKIVAPQAGAKVAAEQVTAEAEIADKGGGIGRIEWRVNGVTLGVETRGLGRADSRAGGTQSVKQDLFLEPGDNVIEVVAYNAKGLIASTPATIKIAREGAVAAKPRLHVLAVGVNDYFDSRLRLTYAVPDAKALGEALRQAGAGVYESAEITTVLDADVTTANLDKVFAAVSKKVRPSDVFVFFLAGHGKTVDGRYYFLPQDFRYQGEESIAQRGVGQDRWQQWFARIPAKKSILLYDTCESGTLTGERVAQRGLERVAALDRMTQAMGRTVLTAATDDAPALEGYRGHGVFTYALLDAMGRADANKNGLIEITELAAHVDREVPELSFQAFKLRQVPQMKIVGSNFALVGQVAVLPQGGAAAPAIPIKPTHVVMAASDVLDRADGKAVQKLMPGTLVTLVKTEAGWTLVARDGKPLGYVAASSLTPIQ